MLEVRRNGRECLRSHVVQPVQRCSRCVSLRSCDNHKSLKADGTGAHPYSLSRPDMFNDVGVVVVPRGPSVSKVQVDIWRSRIEDLGGRLWQSCPPRGAVWDAHEPPGASISKLGKRRRAPPAAVSCPSGATSAESAPTCAPTHVVIDAAVGGDVVDKWWSPECGLQWRSLEAHTPTWITECLRQRVLLPRDAHAWEGPSTTTMTAGPTSPARSAARAVSGEGVPTSPQRLPHAARVVRRRVDVDSEDEDRGYRSDSDSHDAVVDSAGRHQPLSSAGVPARVRVHVTCRSVSTWPHVTSWP